MIEDKIFRVCDLKVRRTISHCVHNSVRLALVDSKLDVEFSVEDQVYGPLVLWIEDNL